MLSIIRQFRQDISPLDTRAVFALVYAAVGLTCITYLKDANYLRAILKNTPWASVGVEAAEPTSNNLYGLVWWVFVSVFFYFVVPAVWVRVVQRRALSEIGIKLSIEEGFWKLLAVCVVIMLPIVYAMSLTASFSEKYPFLRFYTADAPVGSVLLIWELVYFLQFFGLEFFFRGFMVHSLKPSLGIYSIFVMTVPYTMIHFQKPMPETLAAIFAGIFLGWLSYRNGSIWLGLILHCVVAFSMDIMALYQKGILP